ncbi:hypothetical protein BROUX41_000042 [Berkeleyomyces rouxiae]|uniref:uncharacterized protein n=1 Tax=Berkeleyomyces rouxiae TaxID=2035830 RepID=UPI003B81C540
MKLSLFSAPLILAAQIAAETLPLRVISFNIRYDAGDRQDGEKPWNHGLCGVQADRCRRNLLVKQLNGAASGVASGGASVVGLQEVLEDQLEDILGDLGNSWKHVGVGRDNGKGKGEFVPILYRSEDLEVVHSEVKWLSESPDKPSTAWGAKTKRIVTLAVFKHLRTGHQFIHANTHLDNVSSEARSKGIKAVVDHIKALQGTYGPLDVSLTGDFNSAPGGDAYQALVEMGFVADSYNLASPSAHVGPLGNTFTGFQSGLATSRIDFVWLGGSGTQEQPYTVTRYENMDNLVENVFISDHRLVSVDVEVQI